MFLFLKMRKKQITDTNSLKTRSFAGYLPPSCKIVRCDKNIAGKVTNLKISIKMNFPTANTKASSILPIGDCFMYVGRSSIKLGLGVFVSFERSDFFQISNISFYSKRFSTPTSNAPVCMRTFRKYLSRGRTWQTRYTLEESLGSSSKWTEDILLKVAST